ncbi:MAG: FecR domain-containing protein, partial [Chlorobiales bacterium]|nr:FecR domain-containing protein [Chlorobiales bacterium]
GFSIYRVRIAAAAAILILLATLSIFLLKPDEPHNIIGASQKVAAQFDIKPGGNKATLTLADGQILVLDSTTSGILAQQGQTAVMRSGTQLVYEVDHSSSITPYSSKDSIAMPVAYNVLNTPRGGEQMLVLPDGSKAWLNAFSSIKFPTAFTGKNRKVEVRGEVYFEIAHNPAMPFIVNVNNRAEIKVLGTHFNVNAYEDESIIRTTLLEGRVSVSSSPLSTAADKPDGQVSPSVSSSLSPGQQASLDQNNQLSVEMVDVTEVVAWKNGVFIFHSSDIQTIMRQIARWYDVEVVYEKTVVQHFNGSIPRNASLISLLEALAETGEVRFKIEGKTITVI